MAENEQGVVAEQEQAEFVYPITVEDAGPGAKKVSVEIPGERIAEKLSEQFAELRQEASIPGFRAGHVPRKLIEKRFDKDVRDQVRRALISESYNQAIEKNTLKVLGDPEFQDEDKLELPQEGSLHYSFKVDIQPEFQLPPLENLKVKKPRVEVTEEQVDLGMQNLREQQGTLVPVEDRGVQEKDYVVANVHVKHDGNIVTHQHEAQLVARPGRVAGIQIDDLAEKLKDARPGETRTIEVKAPATHAEESIRDKDVQIEVEIIDIKHLEAADLGEDFLAEMGLESLEELRGEMRRELTQRLTSDALQAMRQQVNNYLLQNVTIDLPHKLSERQTSDIFRRRLMTLMLRGVPREQIEQNLESVKGGAEEEAVRELKLFFILEKVAETLNVDVDEAELNGQIAMIAAQRERRPEKLKSEMAKDGSLANLFVQLREQKAIDKVLETATVEEISVDEFADELKRQQEMAATKA